MKTETIAHALIVLAAGIAAAGCTTPEMMAPEPPVVTAHPRIEAERPAAKSETIGTLAVDERIVKACGLPTPHFGFDSAVVPDQSDTGLDRIAVCFTTGPLAGRTVRLIGHADPRGELEYNFALGQRRAGSVANYIQARGVPATHVETGSRGALDAVGTGEETWALDRRVDMVLAE